MRFPAAIATMRAGGSLNAAILHYFDFKDDPKRCWMGFGNLTTTSGEVWEGIGDLVAVDGGGQQIGVIANNLTLTLSGTSDLISDDLTAKALDSENQVTGRRYWMALQFCDEDWQAVDDYRVIYVGVMDRMSFKRSADLRQIILNVESPFVRRRVARLETFSDRDQKSKYPTDRAFEFISSLEKKTVLWPKY